MILLSDLMDEYFWIGRNILTEAYEGYVVRHYDLEFFINNDDLYIMIMFN